MGEYYFFDVNKHRIVHVSKEVYDLLETQKRTADNINHPVIDRLKANGFLSSNKVEEICHPFTSMLEDFLGNKLRKICLQVTQQCNFRCNYCVYSGGYENRKHSAKRMNWITAKKGIDFLISHSKDSSRLDVGFYGGEPLLEFDLIKKAMNYATEAAEGKSVTFNITTNGSLLTEEIARFLLKYNTTVVVSIDGPKDIHDKNRVFAANGCGTFDTVYNNVKAIIRNVPDIKERLFFSMVIDPAIQLNCLNEFVATEVDLFKDINFRAGFISDNYRRNELKATEDFQRDWQYSKFIYFLSLFDRVRYKSSEILRGSCQPLLNFISDSKLSYSSLPKKGHHSGPCIPGQLRLFMSTGGDFFPCERVSEKSEIMKIGNVDEGFNIDKVSALLNLGKLTENNCKNCFAFRGCSICGAMIDTGSGELCKELKLSECNRQKFMFEERLKDACTLQELGFNSLNISKQY